MNTLNKGLLSQVIDAITDMDNDSTILLWNEYANNSGYESIFNNDEQTINDLFLTPYDAIRQTNNIYYKDNEDYFTFNGYGHAVSFDYRLSDNSPIDIEELAAWLISEDKLSDYDIDVVTVDDMLASIEDNITDDENMLYSLMDYLNISYDSEKASLLGADYETLLIEDCIYKLSKHSYNQLQDIITMLGISYK